MAKKTKMVSLRLTQSFYAELARVAKEDKRTVGDWIRLKLAEVMTTKQAA